MHPTSHTHFILLRVLNINNVTKKMTCAFREIKQKKGGNNAVEVITRLGQIKSFERV